MTSFVKNHISDSWAEQASQEIQNRVDQWQGKAAERFRQALAELSPHWSEWQVEDGVVKLKGVKNYSKEEVLTLGDWRKGPFQLNELFLDSEWRSDFKWKRLAPHLGDLTDKIVMDIGCNNGYFFFPLLERNPQMIIGIEPVLKNHAQWKFLSQGLNLEKVHFSLLGVEHLPWFRPVDVILSMGILYHHRNPLAQLMDLHRALKEGGELYLETIGLIGNEETCLTPTGKYNGMKNVWFLPTLKVLKFWIKKAGFQKTEILSQVWNKEDEQRVTPFSRAQSFSHFMKDPQTTIEGHPGPERFLIKAVK